MGGADGLGHGAEWQGASDMVAPAKGFQRHVAAEKASDARDHEGRVLQSVAHDRGRRWIHL